MFTVGGLDRYVGRYIGGVSTNISTDSRSRVGRESVDTRAIVGRCIGRDVRRPI